ncbi:MAG: DUF547 domain-containing protein [Bacteroidetes bacterium]|nr:DUF547 domain-containing protein [Bacteroidota bacterium]
MKIIKTLILIFYGYAVFAQSDDALNISVQIANNARFKPFNKQQIDLLANADLKKYSQMLKTDEQKFAFWLNIYNSFMLLNLRDTANAGNYTNFYKKREIVIAQKKLSLFDIEHEFLRCGIKNKTLGFKKSSLTKKDSLIKKLKPTKNDYRVIFCMYRGLFGYPPFQIIENADISEAFNNFKLQHINNFSKNNKIVIFDWIKNYKKDLKSIQLEMIFDGYEINYLKTPKAVYIDNFFPKYEKVKFDEEELNPWLNTIEK